MIPDYLKDNNTLSYILENTNKENYKSSLETSYKYVKSVINNYYEYYDMLFLHLLLEKLDNIDMKYSYLKIINLDIPLNKERNTIIDNIIYETRIYLLKIMKLKIKDNLYNIDFTNYCKLSSEYIEYLCNKYGIKNYTIPIYPAYENIIKVYNGSGYHYINIILYNNDYYLIDVTYLQFFNTWRNNIERIGMTNIQNFNVGTNILRNDKGKDIVLNILYNGYIKLTKEIFKIYLDAFTISFRNGLYYERYNDYNYITDYSIEDYINFLINNDNQIKHEGLSNLGFQMKPLSKKISPMSI